MKKVICITGAAHGLGREMVAALSVENQVVAIDLESEILPKLASKMGCDYAFCDVTSHIVVKECIEKIIKKHGRIDVLINNAGAYIDGPISHNDPDIIRKVIEVNTLGPINMCRFVVPFMQKRKSGTIININSQAGLYPRALFSVYHGSKWAITGFTQSLRLEMVPFGIKVTGIFPGLMHTSFTKGSECHRDLSESLDVEDVVKSVQFVLSCKGDVTIPEIGIRHI